MPHDRRHDKPAGTARRVHGRGGAAGGLWVAPVLDRATNIDEVVGKHPKSDPAFDADIASMPYSRTPIGMARPDHPSPGGLHLD